MEILNTYAIYDGFLNFLPMIPLVAGIIFIIKTIMELIMQEWKNVLISLLITVLCFGMFYGLVQIWNKSETIRHEVIVRDYNDIDLSKYKIIENRGKIIIIEEIK
jgi:hypothetical protein